MKRYIIILAIGFLCSNCNIFEPYRKVFYHDSGAEGYIYYDHKPIPYAIIHIHSYFSKTWAITEIFVSDTTGFFIARFPRRTEHEDIKEYWIGIINDTLYYDNDISISPSDLFKSNGNIQLGILNLTKIDKYY